MTTLLAYHDDPKIKAKYLKRVRALHQKIKSYSRVASTYGVSRSLVAQIVRGELWS